MNATEKILARADFHAVLCDQSGMPMTARLIRDLSNHIRTMGGAK